MGSETVVEVDGHWPLEDRATLHLGDGTHGLAFGLERHHHATGAHTLDVHYLAKGREAALHLHRIQLVFEVLYQQGSRWLHKKEREPRAEQNRAKRKAFDVRA